MPDVSTADTFDKYDDGFGFLKSQGGRDRVLLFAGTSIGSSCLVKYIDDEGNAQTIEDGDITSLPASLLVQKLAKDLQIVTTGSPDFNVSDGGVEGIKPLAGG